MYTGTIYDISINVNTTIALDIQQSQGVLHGDVALGTKLSGGGIFSGTIDATKHFHLVVTAPSGKTALFLEGAVQSATSLSGDYYHCLPSGNTCQRTTGGYGIWNATFVSANS